MLLFFVRSLSTLEPKNKNIEQECRATTAPKKKQKECACLVSTHRLVEPEEEPLNSFSALPDAFQPWYVQLGGKKVEKLFSGCVLAS